MSKQDKPDEIEARPVLSEEDYTRALDMLLMTHGRDQERQALVRHDDRLREQIRAARKELVKWVNLHSAMAAANHAIILERDEARAELAQYKADIAALDKARAETNKRTAEWQTTMHKADVLILNAQLQTAREALVDVDRDLATGFVACRVCGNEEDLHDTDMRITIAEALAKIDSGSGEIGRHTRELESHQGLGQPRDIAGSNPASPTNEASSTCEECGGRGFITQSAYNFTCPECSGRGTGKAGGE